MLRITVFVLGGCHSHVIPSTCSVPDPFQTEGNSVDGCFLPFFHMTLYMLSCPVTCFCRTRCSAFSPLWTWSSDTVASLQKGARLILKELCSHFSAEIAMVVTYVFPSSDLKAQSTVFLRFFSDLGHEKPRLRFELWVSCMATYCASPSGQWASPERVVLLLLYLCCMINTHHLLL